MDRPGAAQYVKAGGPLGQGEFIGALQRAFVPVLREDERSP
jgi:hypothetical protein